MARRTVEQAAGNVSRAARDIGDDSRYVLVLARAGLVARGVMYLIVGWIAIQVAFGDSGKEADQAGAVRLVSHSPFGPYALWLLVAGFTGMTLWRVSEMIYGGPGPDGRKASARAAAFARAVFYGFAVFGLLRFALGLGSSASSDRQSVDLTATVMRHPGGRILVGIAGLAFIAGGIGLAYWAWEKEFIHQFDFTGMGPRLRAAIKGFGRIGGLARGSIFAAAGIFLVIAAIHARPGQAKGIDSTLRALANTPAGPWLLVVVAAGLVTFGLYSCAAAWWPRL